MVAGLVAANPVWHEWVHHSHSVAAEGKGQPESNPSSSGHDGDEADCFLCSVLHQHVVFASPVPLQISFVPCCWATVAKRDGTVPNRVDWVEPAGRAPPVWG